MLQHLVGKGGFAASLRHVRSAHQLPLIVWPIFICATLLALLVLVACSQLAMSTLLTDGVVLCGNKEVKVERGCSDSPSSSPKLSEDVALALLHFASTPEVPQQSKEEIGEVLSVLLQRSPCNFLVYGLWHDSLLWATFNRGGRTVFLDESQYWIDRMRERHPQLETYKVDYGTTLGESEILLAAARDSRRDQCRPHQPIQSSSCPLALSTQLPQKVLSVQWDVILIDGPRSYRNDSFPGRMSPIFTSAVMARTRLLPGHADIFLHDVSRPSEKQYGREFLCMRNMVKQNLLEKDEELKRKRGRQRIVRPEDFD